MNWKKFFAALLAVCLAVSCLCMNAVAVVEDPVDPIKQLEMQPNSDSAPTASPTEIPAPSSNPDGTVGEPDSTPTPDPSPSSTPSATPIPTSTPTPLPTAPVPPTGSTGNTGTDPDSSIGGGGTTETHGEIANAKADGTWGEEYTTCEKCGKHDWWKLSDGTFVCKNCGFNTTGVKETSNVEVWEGGTDLVVLDAIKNAESTGSQSGKDTLSVSISSVGGVDVAGNAEQSAGQTITGTVSVSDIKNLIQVKDSKESQFIRINLEETLSLNPVQAAADKRELAYLSSVLAYQIANAQKEQQYIASVQQQQQAALQREEAYAEMVLAAAAKLQQEADQREAAYLQSVRAAQVAAQKQLMTESELTVKTPSIQKALIVY